MMVATNEDVFRNRMKLVQGAMDAPLLRCPHSRTGHCRFLFKAGDTTICAMFGSKVAIRAYSFNK